MAFSSSPSLHGQDDPPTNAKPSAEKFLQVLDDPPAVLQGATTLPDALYLRDANNQPIFVPHVRYEEFERYLRERSGGRSFEVPSALLEETQITGEIRSGYAELDIELTLSVTDPAAKLVRIPLGFKNFNWTQPPRSEGGKLSVIATSSSHQGVDWILEPDGSPRYKLGLRAVVKTEQAFSESSLPLELPESSTRVALTIPHRSLDIRWLGATGEVFESSEKGETSLVSVRGRGGLGTLVWRDRADARDLGAVEVDSTTRIVRSSEGHEYRATTRLRILSDSRVGPRELTIRLPSRARWLPPTSANPTMAWSLNKAPANTSDRQDLVLRLPESGRGLTEEIPIDWSLDVSQDDRSMLDIQGLEVLGVQRHEGHLRVVLPESFRFKWQSTGEYVLTQQAPASDFVDALEYDFQFRRQPVTLRGEIIEDELQQRWRTDYLVQFDQDELRLDGLLTFASDPHLLEGFEIVGGGWKMDSAIWEKTGEAVRTERVDDSTLRFPASSLAPSNDSLSAFSLASERGGTIRFTAYQTLPTGVGGRVVVDVPRIRSTSAGEATYHRADGMLVIDPRNWLIFWNEVKAVGMVKTSEIPGSIQDLLPNAAATNWQSYRLQSEGAEPRWSGRARRIPQVVSTTIETHLSVDRTEWKATRRWAIQTQGPSLEQIPLRVPSEWIVTDPLNESQILSDRVSLISQGQRIEAQVGTMLEDGWALIEPIRGTWPEMFTLELHCRQPFALSDAAPHGAFESIPVLLPELSFKQPPHVYSNTTTLEVGEGIICEVKQVGGDPLVVTHQDRQVQLPSSAPFDQIQLGIARWVSPREKAVDVERIWVQTIVNDRQRRDRCVVRLRTEQRELRFQLPEWWTKETTSILVDGQKVAMEGPDNDGYMRLLLGKKPLAPNGVRTLTSETPTTASPSVLPSLPAPPIVIEYWHLADMEPSWVRSLGASTPFFEATLGPAPIVWSVHVPYGQHLWSASNTLLSNQRWVWRNLFWRRVNDYTQEIAESEIGASRQPLLAMATNDYVFSSLGDPAPQKGNFFGDILLIPRFLLWCPVALLALLMTALWPKLGVIRNPWMLLLIFVCLGLLSMIAPDISIMLTQAAIGSLLVLVLVAAFRWTLRQRGHRRSVFIGRPAPNYPSRSAPRSNLEDSVPSQARAEIAPNGPASPSTHSLEHIPSAASPEVR